MAAKSSKRKSAEDHEEEAAPSPPPIRERLVIATLDMAITHGWRELSMAEVATLAEVSLADAYRAFPTKAHLLAGVFGHTDLVVLAGGPVDSDESPRDRLFDVLMRRFDALSAHREAYLAILRDLPTDPPALLLAMPLFANSIAWMLETAGISASGWSGALKVQAVALVYLRALRTWTRDDSADLGRTMAALDKGLRQAESWARRWPWALGPGRRRDAADAGDAGVPAD